MGVHPSQHAAWPGARSVPSPLWGKPGRGCPAGTLSVQAKALRAANSGQTFSSATPSPLPHKGEGAQHSSRHHRSSLPPKTSLPTHISNNGHGFAFRRHVLPELCLVASLMGKAGGRLAPTTSVPRTAHAAHGAANSNIP